MADGRRFYEAPADGLRRSAPAALRNRESIAEVLGGWLPASGLLLEIASGTGEHAAFFANRFPQLDWQPSDIHGDALRSIEEWRKAAGLANIRKPLEIDASMANWPIDRADVVLSINMVHISPWASALGLLDGAARLLPPGGALILYGPWLKEDITPAPSNLAFDSDLRARDPQWGLRSVEAFTEEARKRGLSLEETRSMPANNLMLLLRPNRSN
jgi:hypothetical protein